MKLRKISVRNADTGEFEQILAFKGGDGKTPVKGVDYNTTTDRQEIIDAVIGNIPSIDIDGAIGAHNDNPSSHADIRTLIVQYFASSKTYTNEQIALLIGTAPELLNTLEEIAEAIVNNESVVDALNDSIANKLGREDAKRLYVALQGYVAYSQSDKDKLEGIDMASKQNKTDDALDTTSKDIVGAINEIKANPTGVYINAKTVENHVLSENIDKGDLVMIQRVISGDNFTLLPTTLPEIPTKANGCFFSSDGIYLVVTGYYGGFTTYERRGNEFTKLINFSVNIGIVKDCSFSQDSTYLAIAHDNAPYVTIYKRNGDEFTKSLALPGIPSSATSCSFSPDGIYLAVTAASSHFTAAYKRSGDDFTKLPPFITLADNINNPSICLFSPDGIYLAVGYHNSPYVTMYKRNGDEFTKAFALPGITGSTISCSFSPDGIYLAVSHNNAPHVTIYKKRGVEFIRLLALQGVPWYATSCSFSPDGIYLATISQSSLTFKIHRRDGDEFTELLNVPQIGASTYACSFSHDSSLFAVAHYNVPYINIYKISNNIIITPTIKRTKDTLSKGIALEQGIAGETKPILITEKY